METKKGMKESIRCFEEQKIQYNTRQKSSVAYNAMKSKQLNTMRINTKQ